MRHITPIVGAIWHTSWGDRAVEDVAIDTGAIHDGSQVVDDSGFGSMPREIHRSSATTFGRCTPQRSNGKSSGIARNVHLSQEQEIQAGDRTDKTKEAEEHSIQVSRGIPCHLCDSALAKYERRLCRCLFPDLIRCPVKARGCAHVAALMPLKTKP
jgi:hypothetical protein